MSDKTDMRLLHISCEGEFYARLLCLASGLALARASKLEARIVWPQTEDCSVLFSDVFLNDEFVVNTSFEAAEESILTLHLAEGRGGFDEVLDALKSDTRDVYYSITGIPSYLEDLRLVHELVHLRFRGEFRQAAASYKNSGHLPEEYFGLFVTLNEINKEDPEEAGSALYLVRQSRDKVFFICSLESDAESFFEKEPNVVLRKKETHTVQASVVDLFLLTQSLIIKTSGHPMLLAGILLKAAGVSLVEPLQAASFHVGSPKKVVDTYCQWHLGDNLILLHFLRKMSERYPDVEFRHALNPEYLGQCNEVIQDLSSIRLSSIPDTQFSSQPINGWKGADGFYFEHPKSTEYGTVFVDFFARMARKMGLESPIKNTEMLLFDYPALKREVLSQKYDFLVVNSVPLSGQFRDYEEDKFNSLLNLIQEKGFSVITTKKADGFDCTLDFGLTVTGIGNVSLYSHFLVADFTGSMWPCMNIFNNYRHERKILLNCQEVVDFGQNVVMVKTMDEAKQELESTLSMYRPIRVGL
ncbi:MAG: hypothetical protein WCL08_02730 [Verrucomicrobiota bacterium]